MSNLEIRLKNGREEITGEKLNKISKKENRIEYAAEKLLRVLEDRMIRRASSGKNSSFTFSKIGGRDVIKMFNIKGEGKKVFEKALKKAKEKYEGKGIEFKIGKHKRTGSRKLIAEW